MKHYAIQYTDKDGFPMFATRDGNPMIYRDRESAAVEMDVYKAELREIMKGNPVYCRKWFRKKLHHYEHIHETEQILLTRVYKTLHVAGINLRPTINKVL